MKLLLVDGHYYAYRSFFAIQNLTNSAGKQTNAIFGFYKALRRMLHELKPDLVAVIFDGGIPERRSNLQPDYKANRAETPEGLTHQLPEIEEIVSEIGCTILRVPGEEADDLMAAIVQQAYQEAEIILATNDKDLMQLVSPPVRIYQSGKKTNEYQLLGEQEVTAKWGVPPQRIGDLLALTGDSSDNIRGVPGVGPKTAANLIQQFGNLESLLSRLTEVNSEKLRQALESSRAQILSNREMVRLHTAISNVGDWRQWQLQPNYPKLLNHLRQLEFRSLEKEIEQEMTTGVGTSTRQGELFN